MYIYIYIIELSTKQLPWWEKPWALWIWSMTSTVSKINQFHQFHHNFRYQKFFQLQINSLINKPQLCHQLLPRNVKSSTSGDSSAFLGMAGGLALARACLEIGIRGKSWPFSRKTRATAAPCLQRPFRVRASTQLHLAFTLAAGKYPYENGK